jgi:HK97 family phage major capsid protein
MKKMWIKLLKDAGAYKAGEIVEADEVIAKAYIEAGAAEASQDAAGALNATLGAEIGKQMAAVTDELRKGLEAIARDLKETTKSIVRADPGESEADKTKSFRDQLACITKFQKRGDQESFDRLVKVYKATPVGRDGEVIRAHEGAAGSTGGFLVGEEYGGELLKLDPESDVFAAGVRTVPMGSPVKKYPALRQTSNPASGASAAHGGIRTYRKSEKAARTASDSSFDEVELQATDLIAYTEATRDLLADAPGAEADFMSLIRGALGWRRDYDFIRGPGKGEPLGYFNCPALISVTRESSGGISYYDVLTMLSKIMPAYWMQCEFHANPTTLPQLAAMKDDAGNAVWINGQQGAAGQLPPTLLGRPVKFTEKVPPLGTAGDLDLVVPALYLEGLRSGIEIGVSEDFLFSTDMVAYRAKIRNDGQPWIKGTYKMADGSNTAVSGFVQLN